MTDAKKAAKRAKFAKGFSKVLQKDAEAKRAKFAKGFSKVLQKDAEDTLKRQMQDVLSREALQAAVRKRKSQVK